MSHVLGTCLFAFVVLVLLAVVTFVISGLFGKRTDDCIPEHVEEPTEEEFNSPE